MSDCEICGNRLDEDNFSPYCSSPDCRKAEEQAQKSDRAEAAIYQQKKQLQAKYDALKASHTKLVKFLNTANNRLKTVFPLLSEDYRKSVEVQTRFNEQQIAEAEKIK